MTTLEEVKKLFTEYNDFPISGQLFRDLQPILSNSHAIQTIRQALLQQWKNMGITKIVVPESMGYFFGSILAADLNCGLVMARKPGKLPGKTVSTNFFLQYKQKDEGIEIEKGILGNEDIILIHDDSVHTGSTAKALKKLIETEGVKKVYMSFLFQIDKGGFDLGDYAKVLLHFE